MRLPLFLSLSVTSLASAGAHADAPQGTWKYERSMDYFGRTANTAPPPATLLVRANEVALSASCVARFSTEDYLFSDVFQPLSRQGISEKQLDRFLTRHFNLSLTNTRTVYSLTSSPGNCAGPVLEFLQVGDRLLIPVGITFHSYLKGDGGKPAAAGDVVAAAAPSLVANYSFTPLPMDYDRYYAECRPRILGSAGKPKTTDKCAPAFYPYVADPKSSDALMKLVGNHDYAKGGQEYAGGFSPPFRQRTAATFLVFPPLKQVVLVRVDDFERVRNEERDVMSGVYLSIAGGKVVDQISGCHFNRDYVCLDDGRVVARLLDSGKFQRQ